MCIPKSSARKQQTKTAAHLPSTDAEQLRTSCPNDQPRPKLVSITVTDANPLGNDTYWAVKDGVRTVTVRAVTSPDDASGWDLLTWTGASSVSGDKRDATIALDAVKDVTVSAQLDAVTKTAKVEIYDLVSVSCPLPNGKGYLSEATTRLKAVTNPDEAKVWQHLTWSEGTPTSDRNENDAALKPVGKRTVTATLGAKSLPVDVKVCQWPTLKIKEITFEGHDVYNDGVGQTPKTFDKKWIRGRKEHSLKDDAADVQSLLCFTRRQKVKLSAKFEVVDKATENEDVKIEANLGFGKLEGSVKVSAGAAEASLAATQSDVALPDVVDAGIWTISWRHRDHADTKWLDADQSNHMRYVLLGDPEAKARLYWTLLDISCVAAKGKKTDDDFVTVSFEPFKAATGKGNGFKRRGDGVEMSYYNEGTSTATGSAVQTTEGMLGSASGTGRCGGWATLLIHTWKMHGVVATERWYIRAVDTTLLNFDLRFLVKNCKFGSGTLANSAYTHKGERAKNEVIKEDGIGGHGKNNPQFDFGDHVVVKYKGKLYDPSYGVGPYVGDDAYLADALAGLGKWPKIKFVHDGTPQHIPKECVPYADGFAEYTIVKEPFEQFAKDTFGKTGAQLFRSCVFADASSKTRLFPAKIADVTSDMEVKIWDGSGYEVYALPPTVTLKDIAQRHGKTEDEIFDDPKNAAIKAKRGKKENLMTFDLIVVSKALDPNCWLVVGHDL